MQASDCQRTDKKINIENKIQKKNVSTNEEEQGEKNHNFQMLHSAEVKWSTDLVKCAGNFTPVPAIDP